jgi:hypothetical protein
MLCDFWDQIGTGPVRYLAESWEALVAISEMPHQELLDYFLAIPPADWPKEVRIPYKESALALARTFSCMQAMDEGITALDIVSFWPIRNSAEYADMLGNWHPGALILLAHYCIVLHRVGMQNWYLEGRAATVLSTIVRRLDPAWHRYIEWPLSEVGVTASTKRISNECPIGSLAIVHKRYI